MRMKNYLRCKACGYIIEEGRLKDVCPACGMPSKAFESYKQTINEKRLAALEKHIHPVLIHLVMSPTMLNIVLLLLVLFASGSFNSNLWVVIRFNIYLLPFFTLIALLTGIYDGKLRFKKLTTPILKKKIILGSTFLVLTIIGALVLLGKQENLAINIVLLVIALLCMGLAGILGTLGSSIFGSKTPG
jgi:uncharacterized membrane protein YvbJ